MLELEYHLKEIKYRSIYTIICFINLFIINLYYYPELLFLLIKPLINYDSEIISSNPIISIKITEIFKTILYFNTFISIFITSLFFIYQIWLFIFPGLYKWEYNYYKNKLKIILIVIPINYYFTLIKLLPFFYLYFHNYTKILNIYSFINLQDYLIFLLNLSIIFIISILLPYCFYYLIKWEIIPKKYLYISRKIIYFLFLCIYAFITPPDLLSLFIFTIPIIMVFEACIFYSYIRKIYKIKLQNS